MAVYLDIKANLVITTLEISLSQLGFPLRQSNTQFKYISFFNERILTIKICMSNVI